MLRSLLFIGFAILLSAATLRADKPAEDASAEVYIYSAAAIVAGGCFWCVESDFEKLKGVGDVVSGYTGGDLQNPTYRNHKGHIEAARIPFDPSIISYRELMDYFFRHIDPLDDGGQFCDRGYAYTTAIFYQGDEQKRDAEAAKAAAKAELGQPVVTPLRPAAKFWIAEDYHQDYYKKNPVRYKFYRQSCGRDRRVKAVWGK
ncbi:MAG: peptide-methionine (S)-S-oxide reductase MsrA [Marinicaulis sp.]|nr:peptide-methionine (S)-S-oxide reductase MsrA [Marinicaulis sp.]NNE40885.1 peptide-methionine (S)-S-oxide reductase MsrA [Marinicaulis sp.]NNL89253.1 peptide-methionine (S)-S-oxide reductase MsrA [Marinicaulis sp.]